jgi:hypothetical protein
MAFRGCDMRLGNSGKESLWRRSKISNFFSQFWISNNNYAVDNSLVVDNYLGKYCLAEAAFEGIAKGRCEIGFHRLQWMQEYADVVVNFYG